MKTFNGLRENWQKPLTKIIKTKRNFSTKNIFSSQRIYKLFIVFLIARRWAACNFYLHLVSFVYTIYLQIFNWLSFNVSSNKFLQGVPLSQYQGSLAITDLVNTNTNFENEEVEACYGGWTKTWRLEQIFTHLAEPQLNLWYSSFPVRHINPKIYFIFWNVQIFSSIIQLL